MSIWAMDTLSVTELQNSLRCPSSFQIQVPIRGPILAVPSSHTFALVSPFLFKGMSFVMDPLFDKFSRCVLMLHNVICHFHPLLFMLVLKLMYFKYEECIFEYVNLFKYVFAILVDCGLKY